MEQESDNLAAICPLCNQPNNCGLADPANTDGNCWCFRVVLPNRVVQGVPADAVNKRCICRACVDAYHGVKSKGAAEPRK
jgi:hypothetical protein